MTSRIMFSSLRLHGKRFPKTSCIRFNSKTTRSKYSDTLNLPKSNLAATSISGTAVKREERIQKVCSFDKLYEWQRRQETDKEFVLHDGPPYANGRPHVGHALNKILKDITNRYKLLTGHRVHYVPGWDCHGLPIELKALKEDGARKTNMAPLKIREKSYQFALEAIEVQSKAFQSWGVMADWENSYHTVHRSYQTKELDVFYKMYQKGLVYENFMPVFWSPSSRTALAESELEYNQSHVSNAVYVKFPIIASTLSAVNIPGLTERNVYAVIWTTTPWTIPVNQAICYNDSITYCILEDKSSGHVFLCEKVFVEELVNLLLIPLTVLREVPGSSFGQAQYTHPLSHEVLPFLPASHVISGKGTGFVHTAPAHGQDDFKVAVKHGLSIKSLVDDDGVFTTEVGSALHGKAAGEEADTVVLNLLKDQIMHTSKYVHSYPYDWRTKLPIIIKASKQWFMDTNKVKGRAMECLKTVEILPKSSENGMLEQLKGRPYWCISRQRAWGLPIPVFYHRTTGKHLINSETIEHLKTLFVKHGSDCWWSMSEEQLLPMAMLDQMGESWTDYSKGRDILDIWFDSGSSWSVLHTDGVEKADMYVEGLDQFGGWFQSSLLTSVAVNDTAPYRKLVVHGFALDENGNKMSKSVGNVVDPHTVIYGGKNQKKEPSYGVDVLRWWAAHACLSPQVPIGPAVLERCNDDIFKLRKVLRFMLGNLFDFRPDKLLAYEDLWPQDQYMLYRIFTLSEQVSDAYENFNYAKVVDLVNKFTNVQLSKFYSTIIKNRLYCNVCDDKSRLATQTVLYHGINTLMRMLAPIVPHLAEELCQNLPSSVPQGERSVFKSGWLELDPAWADSNILSIMQPVLTMKEDIDLVAEVERPVEYDLTLFCSHNLNSFIKQYHQSEDSSATSALTEILQTSYIHLTTIAPDVVSDDCVVIKGASNISVTEGVKGPEEYVLILTPARKKLCQRCRRYTADLSTTPCEHCLSALASEWA